MGGHESRGKGLKGGRTRQPLTVEKEPAKMRLCLPIVLALLCCPACLADPLLYITHAEEGKEAPSKVWLNPQLEDVVPSFNSGSPAQEASLADPAPLITYEDNANLNWVKWEGSLPNGAVGIYNGYTERTEYICKVNCESGFYTPSKGNVCLYPYANKEYSSSKFEVLVNVDDFEFLEWIEDSYGSVPKDSVKTCAGVEIYVGKNKYGLGKVVPMHEAFFLPWEGDEYWYKKYQVLAINTDAYSQHISHVEYGIDQMELFHHAPETMQMAKVTNLDCNSVLKTVKLEKTSTVEKSWDIGRSTRNGTVSTMKAKIPIISPGNVEMTKEQLVSFSEGTTMVETIAHSISVELIVPPNHWCGVRMEGRKMTADIPFKGRLSRTYENGDTHWTTITGTYDGVRVGEINAVVERCLPVTDAVPCYEMD